MNTPTSQQYSEIAQAEGIAKLPWKQPKHTIYKVHDELRNINKEAYKPLLISIGPYHYHNENLKKMESLKLHCLRSFLRRKEGTNFHGCISVVEKVEAEARECYAESINLKQAEFIKMLVLDGCFIIEFALRYVDVKYWNENDPPLLVMDWARMSIKRDLWLFENQIPFFIIYELFNLINDQNQLGDLTSLLLEFFGPIYAKKKGPIDIQSSTNIQHLLELLQRSWVLAFQDQNSEETSKLTDQKESSHKCKLITRKVQDFISSATRLAESVKPLLKLIHRRVSTGEDSKEASIPMDQGDSSENCEQLAFISSATRLVESNVKFENTEDSFRINFKYGRLRLPHLDIGDKTESFFRNLIAYEQYSLDGKRHVIDYVTFMDCLINTPTDVKLLMEHGIIENWIGSEEAVVHMFNKLTIGVSCSSKGFIYKLQFEEVNKHCSLPKNAWWAMLKKNHLNSPWRIISVIAAFVLLALTLVQTVFTVLK